MGRLVLLTFSATVPQKLFHFRNWHLGPHAILHRQWGSR
jgi:hypothetical protein